jgi:hypothetical protein
LLKFCAPDEELFAQGRQKNRVAFAVRFWQLGVKHRMLLDTPITFALKSDNYDFAVAAPAA